MEDRKVEILASQFDAIRKVDAAYIWLVLPGGLMTGRPIYANEYISLLTGKPSAEPAEKNDNAVILALKDAVFKTGNSVHHFNVATVDIRDVSAWGAYDPKKSYLSSE